MTTATASHTTEECWVCGGGFAAMPHNHDGSPLGGAFSMPKCDPCIDNRATSPKHAAWFANDEVRWIAEGNLRYWKSYDVDGTEEHGGVAVTVYGAGAYVPYATWRDSKAGRDASKIFRLWERHSRAGWFDELGPIPPMPSLLKRLWWCLAPYVARPRLSAISVSNTGLRRIKLY